MLDQPGRCSAMSWEYSSSRPHAATRRIATLWPPSPSQSRLHATTCLRRKARYTCEFLDRKVDHVGRARLRGCRSRLTSWLLVTARCQSYSDVVDGGLLIGPGFEPGIRQGSGEAMVVGLVVPCYNEENRWDPIYWTSLFAVEGLHWLLVDDGSTDDTRALLTSFRQDNVEVLGLDRNAGKGEAVRRGLQEASRGPKDWIGFMDADGAFTIEEVSRFAALMAKTGPETQAIWSSRVRMRGRHIQRSTTRHAVGRTIATTLSLRYRDLPYDSQAGMKFFRNTEQIDNALSWPFQTRWLFDVELYARLEKQFGAGTGWLWEEPLDSWSHVEGSKVSSREFMRISVEIAKLLSLHSGGSRASRPE